MKKHFVLLFAALLLSAASCEQRGKTESLRGNLEWSIADSTLTISGSGAMRDYPAIKKPYFEDIRLLETISSPWEEESFASVVIEKGVTEIGYGAFYDYCDLTSVSLPNSLTKIGNKAFAWSRNLTSVILPNSLTSIGDKAFYYCSGLTSVTIPNSVTSIGYGAFYSCRGLTSLTVEAGSASYSSDDGVLFNSDKTVLIQCPGGKTANYVIPNSVTSIGRGAFYDCRSLTSVAIPNSVTSIGDEAFTWCIGLTSVAIPDSVTSIGNEAFFWCVSLTSVAIPNSVTSIGYEAFFCCVGLTSVTVKWATPLSIEHNVFGSLRLASLTLRVPAGTKSLYKAADVWKEFGKIVEQ